MEQALLTTEEVSSMFSLAESTLRRWRTEKIGPKYIKLSKGQKGAIRYRKEDIIDFISNNEVETM